MNKDDRIKLLSKYNLEITLAELSRCRQAVRDGNIWRLVEQRSHQHPALRDAFLWLTTNPATAEFIKLNEPEAFESLTKTNLRYRFQDKDIILENWGELIELDKDGDYKQVRYSTRVDYVPPLENEKLESFYKARKLLGDLYTSSDFEIKFKLSPGDVMMFDNHRLLHGRTSYDSSEGARHLQGCYLEFDSTDGKLRHLHEKYHLSETNL